ncbi:hypothetical protein ITJ66_10770 [Plantibacter sp. VKM Ac-2885]|uniref:hypothetical protein n=1 Tax=Plantibacter sp. VKM Ac-2885 TaxID=2783828 RepID=UPI00188C90E4|nr:hypothetical protein [Plantibacter sp. VKM Ac-2885]MBF4512966.1 hypothetical protein [Plantibacter sp. VKM Ac-2885]
METLPDPSAATTRVAGRRLVRRLGEGREWTAYSTVLAHAGSAHGGRTDQAAPAGDAVLLRARADAAERDLWRRAAILSRLDHPHIVRLVDVAEDRTGLPSLLVERLAGGTLGELLRRRESIAPGEAVTILAPLVDAIRAAHLSGISHGSISASAVRFADDGRPVLSGWSGAAPVDHQTIDGGLGRTAPAFAADWTAFAGLMDGVLQATDPDEAPSTAAWADVVPELADHEIANRLQQRIHALARPLPVLLDRVDPPSASPADAIRASADRAQRTAPLPPTRRAAVESRRRSRHPGSSLRRLAWRPGRGTRVTAATRSTPSVDSSPRRRRLVIGAAGAAAALVSAAMVFLPSEDPSTAIAPTPAGSVGPASAAVTTIAPPVETPTPPADEADAVDVVTGDDPAAAARELVRRRDQCRTTGEEGCVWDSVERGSPFEDDEHLGVGIGSIDAASLDLVDRQGDAAVLRGTAEPSETDEAAAGRRQPVTLLVVRGETGWRLREVFTAG